MRRYGVGNGQLLHGM